MVKDNDFRLYKSYLAHYGVKGMHWGIRRYQNPDGTLTKLGKSHYRYESYNSKNINNKYIDALDIVYNTLNNKEKMYVNVDPNKPFGLTQDHRMFSNKFGPSLISGTLVYDKDKNPIGFIDISEDYKTQAKIDIVVSNNHRGKGLSNELVKQTINSLDSFGKKHNDIRYLDWVVYKDNAPSRHLAEKIGFGKPSEENEKGFVTYSYENPYYKNIIRK